MDKEKDLYQELFQEENIHDAIEEVFGSQEQYEEFMNELDNIDFEEEDYFDSLHFDVLEKEKLKKEFLKKRALAERVRVENENNLETQRDWAKQIEDQKRQLEEKRLLEERELNDLKPMPENSVSGISESLSSLESTMTLQDTHSAFEYNNEAETNTFSNEVQGNNYLNQDENNRYNQEVQNDDYDNKIEDTVYQGSHVNQEVSNESNTVFESPLFENSQTNTYEDSHSITNDNHQRNSFDSGHEENRYEPIRDSNEESNAQRVERLKKQEEDRIAAMGYDRLEKEKQNEAYNHNEKKVDSSFIVSHSNTENVQSNQENARRPETYHANTEPVSFQFVPSTTKLNQTSFYSQEVLAVEIQREQAIKYSIVNDYINTGVISKKEMTYNEPQKQKEVVNINSTKFYNLKNEGIKHTQMVEKSNLRTADSTTTARWQKDLHERTESIDKIKTKQAKYSAQSNIEGLMKKTQQNVNVAASKIGDNVKGQAQSAYSDSMGAQMERRHLPLLAAGRASLTLIRTTPLQITAMKNSFNEEAVRLLNPASFKDMKDRKNQGIESFRGRITATIPVKGKPSGMSILDIKPEKLNRAILEQMNLLKQMRANGMDVTKITDRITQMKALQRVQGNSGTKLTDNLRARKSAWKALRSAPIHMTRQAMMAGGDPAISGIFMIGEAKMWSQKAISLAMRPTRLVGRVSLMGANKIGLNNVAYKIADKTGITRVSAWLTDKSNRYGQMRRKISNNRPDRVVGRAVVKTTKKVGKATSKVIVRKVVGKNKLAASLSNIIKKTYEMIARKVVATKAIGGAIIGGISAAITTVISVWLVIALGTIIMSIALTPSETNLKDVTSYLDSKQKGWLAEIQDIKKLEDDDTSVEILSDLDNLTDNRREIATMATIYFNNDFKMSWFDKVGQNLGLSDSNYKKYLEYLFNVSHNITESRSFETRNRTEVRQSVEYNKMYNVFQNSSNNNKDFDDIKEFFLNDYLIFNKDGTFSVKPDILWTFNWDSVEKEWYMDYEFIKTWTEIVEKTEIFKEQIPVENQYCNEITWFEEQCWVEVEREHTYEVEEERSELVQRRAVMYSSQNDKDLQFEREGTGIINFENTGTQFEFVNTVPYEHEVIRVSVDVKRFPEIFEADAVGNVLSSSAKSKLGFDIAFKNLEGDKGFGNIGKVGEVQKGGFYNWSGRDLGLIVTEIYKLDKPGFETIINGHDIEGKNLLHYVEGYNTDWPTMLATKKTNSLLKEVLNSKVGQKVQKDTLLKLVESKLSVLEAELDNDAAAIYIADVMIEYRNTSLTMDLRKLIKAYNDSNPKNVITLNNHYQEIFGNSDAKRRDYAVSAINSRIGELDGTGVPSFQYPLDKLYRVSGEFGPRQNPLPGGNVDLSYHNGIDVAVPFGTTLHSPISGVVVDVQNNTCGGHSIRIQSNNKDYAVRFAHLAERTPLSVGSPVTSGQSIGRTGGKANAGDVCTTGPHMHFEVHLKGVPTNPRDYVDFGANPNGDYSGGGVQYNLEENPTWNEDGGWGPENREWAYNIYVQDWKDLYDMDIPKHINAPVLPIIDGTVIIDDDDSGIEDLFKLLISNFNEEGDNSDIALNALKAYSITYNADNDVHGKYSYGLNGNGFLKYVLNQSGKLKGDWTTLGQGVATSMDELNLKGDGNQGDTLQVGDIGFATNPKTNPRNIAIGIYVGDGRWVSMTSHGVSIKNGAEFGFTYRIK